MMKDLISGEYKKLFKKKDPIDTNIIKLATSGKLKIDITDFDNKDEIKETKYSRKNIPARVKHTSWFYNYYFKIKEKC